MDWQSSKSSLGERFKKLYELQEWTDCKFLVGDAEDDVELIKCHKLVLASSSPVFEALFYGPLAETTEVIRIPDIHPTTFNALLRYLYCDTVALENVTEAGCLLYTAKKYIIPSLTRICRDYLVEHTQMSNFWDVLIFGELLDEKELFMSCIKMMIQFSPKAWSSPSKHLSVSAMSMLLDQQCSKMSELELWKFVVEWARTECKNMDISPSDTNVRKVLENYGLLEKVRFLTFSLEDVMCGLITCEVLSADEVEKLIACLRQQAGAEVPAGLGTCRKHRFRVSSGEGRCCRVIVTKRKTWTYGGTVCTRVSAVDSHVKVIGFEVFTRIPSLADFSVWRGNTDRYNERLSVRITDSDGNELCNTVHNASAEFNASQIVKLSNPVWFSPNRKYTVAFELSPGQYPLSQLSSTASSKLAVFRFEDFTNYPEGYLDFSFVNAVIFSS